MAPPKTVSLETKNTFNLSSVTICILISALCYFFSLGFYDNWWLAWIAPLPIFVVALNREAITTIIAAFSAYFLGSLNALNYADTLVPISSLLVGSLIDAVIFAIIISLSRWVIRYGSPWFSLFAFPALWTSYEFLNSTSIYSGTFNSIAYSQMHVLPIIQLGAYTGIWGVTFLLCLVPSAIACAAYFRHNKTIMTYIVGITAILLVLALSVGFYQLYKTAHPKNSISVGLVAVPADLATLKSQDEKIVVSVIQRYSALIQSLAQQGAKIILLPEKVVAVNDQYKQTVLKLFGEAAQKNNVYLIVGVRKYNNNQLFNLAWIFSPDGTLLNTYNKWHMLPGPESAYTPGHSTVLFKINNIPAGVAICKDLDFIDPSRSYGKLGAQLLFIPALDFHVDDWLHGRIAIMRGIENGYSVIRAAQWGLLSVSDASGRTLKINTDDKKSVALLARVPADMHTTFYNRTGDWFAWAAMGLALICLLSISFVRYQYRQVDSLAREAVGQVDSSRELTLQPI